eukprot:GFUD01071610.1.p1 GENE.GFUD01071610.1~~GFUD01071610.1.p1  ORF type:complete len:150 (-),score=57.09 GFUD01071610.1:83-532(-)
MSLDDAPTRPQGAQGVDGDETVQANKIIEKELIDLREFKEKKILEAAEEKEKIDAKRAKLSEVHKRKRLNQKNRNEDLRRDNENMAKLLKDTNKSLRRANVAVKELFEKRDGFLDDLSQDVRVTCLLLAAPKGSKSSNSGTVEISPAKS